MSADVADIARADWLHIRGYLRSKPWQTIRELAVGLRISVERVKTAIDVHHGWWESRMRDARNTEFALR